MKRAIGMIIIALLLVGFGIWEEIYVDNTIKTLSHNSIHLEKLLDENEENINCPDVVKEFNGLDKFWNKAENNLCYIVNFEKIKPINESIFKLEGAIKENDFSVAMENVKTLQNYSNNLRYIMGASVNNIL